MSTAARPLTLWVPEKLLYVMAEEAEAERPNETGGVMLGHRNGSHIVVRTILDAGLGAARWPTGMRPDSAYQTRAIEGEFEASEGAVTYLGDWHSHPDSIGGPSRRDRRTLRNIATDREALCPEPVMLIFGSVELAEWLPAGWVARLGRLGRFGPLAVEPTAIRPYATTVW